MYRCVEQMVDNRISSITVGDRVMRVRLDGGGDTHSALRLAAQKHADLGPFASRYCRVRRCGSPRWWGSVRGPAHTIHMTTVADLLDFEREHPRAGDRKNEAIRAVLGMTPAAYYRDVFAAAQSLEGWAHDTFTADRVITRVMAAREKRAAWMTRT